MVRLVAMLSKMCQCTPVATRAHESFVLLAVRVRVLVAVLVLVLILVLVLVLVLAGSATRTVRATQALSLATA